MAADMSCLNTKLVLLMMLLLLLIGIELSLWPPRTNCTSEGQAEALVVPMRQQEPTKQQPGEEEYRSTGQGGLGELSLSDVQKYCRTSYSFDVCDDLMAFTGLTQPEFNKRMQRIGHFHFEGEHAFWNPQSTSELAWFYTTSVDYLFANSIHPAVHKQLQHLTAENGIVLDYSGGVGNNILYLANKGIQCQYFGIGQMEKAFAEYRFRKRGLLPTNNGDKTNNLVEIKTPWSAATNWTFDPIHGGLPRDQSLGVILAFDVLEHIPQYHKVVQAMVDSLRIGGLILEVSPFGTLQDNDDPDMRVHVSNGGISMAQAMGKRMKFDRQYTQWLKIAN